jgi:hypothetical protein
MRANPNDNPNLTASLLASAAKVIMPNSIAPQQRAMSATITRKNIDPWAMNSFSV